MIHETYSNNQIIHGDIPALEKTIDFAKDQDIRSSG